MYYRLVSPHRGYQANPSYRIPTLLEFFHLEEWFISGILKNQSSLSFTPNWISIQSWMSNDEFMIINLIQPAITSTLFQTTFYQKTKLVIIDSCNFATFKRIDLKLFKGYFNNPIIYINDKTFYHKIDLLTPTWPISGK